MKLGIAFSLQWIHTVILSTGASVVAETLGWSEGATAAAFVAGFAAGIFPIIRTFFLFALLLVLTNWWQAALLTAPAAFILLTLEGIGNKMIKQQGKLPHLATPQPGHVENLPKGDLKIIDRDGKTEIIPGTSITLGPASLAEALNPRRR